MAGIWLDDASLMKKLLSKLMVFCLHLVHLFFSEYISSSFVMLLLLMTCVKVSQPKCEEENCENITALIVLM